MQANARVVVGTAGTVVATRRILVSYKSLSAVLALAYAAEISKA